MNFSLKSCIFKIILHRIISVVWLTNFLSEIRSLSNHDDETKFHILSVKPSRKFSLSEPWWSLIALYCAVMDVKQSEWPLHIISIELVPTHYGQFYRFSCDKSKMTNFKYFNIFWHFWIGHTMRFQNMYNTF